jgi:hypothetical protein
MKTLITSIAAILIFWQVGFTQTNNYALSFNGANWVEFAYPPSQRPCPTCPFTVEVWISRESQSWLQHFIGKRMGCTEPTFPFHYQMLFNPSLGDLVHLLLEV